MKRDKAARYLSSWLQGVAGTFRDHVAQQREMLCEHCSADDLVIRMRAVDAVALADRLDGVASVIRALHERAEGATSLNCNDINRDAAEERAADKLERYNEQEDGAGNFGFIPHECSFVDIDTGVPRAEDGDTVVRGTR
ncbi:MAG: hypothetical protein ACXWUW_03550, partial [Rhodoplanes sp.]